MKRFLSLSGLGFFLIAAATAAPKDSPIISRITIRGTDIFDLDTKSYLKKFPYTWINTLHIQTKQEVIERELLFKVGDPIDEFLLQETERNLRALSFIQSARVTQFPQRDGSVVVVVYVSDSWTTEPQLNLGGQNRVDSLEVGLREKNLFGLGKRFEVLYNKSPDNIERTYQYTDPRLLGSRWQMNTEYISETDGETRLLSLNHPFFSADTPWAVSMSHEHIEEAIGDFQNNVKVSEFKQTKEAHQIGAATKIGKSRKLVKHAGLRYRKDTAHFGPTDKTLRPLPDEQPNRQTIFLDLEAIRTRFVKLDRVEKMTRVEDFNLGPVINMSPGFSPRALTGHEDTDVFSAALEKRFLSDRTNLYVTRYAYSGRKVFNNGENIINSFLFRYYHRDLPMQTLLFNTRADWGHQLDPDSQLILGGENGMRAYEEDQFVGDRSWVLNIEDRFFFLDDFLNLVSVGAAVFYDVGGAWQRGTKISSDQLHNSIGAGLRLGLTKSSNEVILRIDVSYRLETVPTDSNRIVVSFGTGQAF